MRNFDPNKYYVLNDVRGFRNRVQANEAIADVLNDLGPFRPIHDVEYNVRISGFVKPNGELVTSEQLEKKYNLRCSCHINDDTEFKFFEEIKVEEPEEPESLPKTGSIPVINLTIKTREEAWAAIEMLKGLF